MSRRAFDMPTAGGPMTIKSALMAALLCSFAAGCLGAPDADPNLGDPTLAGGNACNAIALEVIVKGRENRFGLEGQQVALNPGIPIDRICNRVAADCKARCAQAKDEALRSGVTGFQDSDPARLRQMGVLADTFNAAFDIETNFSELGADGPDDGGELVCNAKPLEVIVQGKEHRFGFDGRQVALNPSIPMQNICQQVAAGCTATCNAAKATAEASGIKGFSGDLDLAKLRLMGELADAFNAALGIVTDFADVGEEPGGGGGAVQCNATVLQVIVKGREHRFGFDNRQVALNASIPMANVCQRLSGACAQTCSAAKAAAEATGIKGFSGNFDADKLSQMGTLADGFNAALGNQTTFERQAIFQ
jgi:hypothetical protein